MKKFALRTVVVAVGAACSGLSYAGAITTPATDAAATKYAVEALTSSTAVTLPAITYTMGVDRTTAQDFTVIITPSAGAQFDSTTCVTAIPVVAGAGAATSSVKRASTSECAYEVDVTTAFTTASTLTFTGLKLTSHPLAAVGGSVSVNMSLKDLGETAFIDITSAISRKVASAVQAVNIYAASSDTATTTDVSSAGGPLTGFVVGGAAPADTATIAKAVLTFDNNSASAKAADGSTTFSFTSTTGTAAITLSGTTSGVKANSLCIDLNANSTLCETGEKFTVGATSATLTGIASTTFPAAGATSTVLVSFEADGTTALGTSRTFTVSGTITPQIGAAIATTDTSSKNSTWWVWSANASELMTPYISTNTQYTTRVSMLNTNTTAVTYSVKCYGEGSNVATNGAGGTLSAASTTMIDASSACTFTGVPRGAVKFIINAPINTVKGVYNIVDAKYGSNGFVPLTRPYNAANTSE